MKRNYLVFLFDQFSSSILRHEEVKKFNDLEKEVEAVKLQSFNLKCQLDFIMSHFNLKIKNPEAVVNNLTEKYKEETEE
jgi:hypothetical protein